jgi:hypothetical protein
MDEVLDEPEPPTQANLPYLSFLEAFQIARTSPIFSGLTNRLPVNGRRPDASPEHPLTK